MFTAPRDKKNQKKNIIRSKKQKDKKTPMHPIRPTNQMNHPMNQMDLMI